MRYKEVYIGDRNLYNICQKIYIYICKILFKHTIYRYNKKKSVNVRNYQNVNVLRKKCVVYNYMREIEIVFDVEEIYTNNTTLIYNPSNCRHCHCLASTLCGLL